MRTQRLLATTTATAFLVVLIVGHSAPPSLAAFPASEHYRLIDSAVLGSRLGLPESGRVPIQTSDQYQLTAWGVENEPAAMQSGSYVANQGVALLPEVAPPAASEHYRLGADLPQQVFLPLVLRS
jgi:hypothetical protein